MLPPHGGIKLLLRTLNSLKQFTRRLPAKPSDLPPRPNTRFSCNICHLSPSKPPLTRPIHTYKATLCFRAWWSFATSADKQRIETFLRPSVRLDMYSAVDPSVSQRVEDTDDELFCAVLTNSHHVLHHILPDRTSHS